MKKLILIFFIVLLCCSCNVELPQFNYPKYESLSKTIKIEDNSDQRISDKNDIEIDMNIVSDIMAEVIDKSQMFRKTLLSNSNKNFVSDYTLRSNILELNYRESPSVSTFIAPGIYLTGGTILLSSGGDVAKYIGYAALGCAAISAILNLGDGTGYNHTIKIKAECRLIDNKSSSIVVKDTIQHVLNLVFTNTDRWYTDEPAGPGWVWRTWHEENADIYGVKKYCTEFEIKIITELFLEKISEALGSKKLTSNNYEIISKQ